MGRRGRPRVVDEAMRKMITGLVSAGCSQNEAARRAGCAPSTLSKAIRDDPDFAARMRRACLERELNPVARLHRQSRRSWRATVWILKERWPSRYRARRAKLTAADLWREVRDRLAETLCPHGGGEEEANK